VRFVNDSDSIKEVKIKLAEFYKNIPDLDGNDYRIKWKQGFYNFLMILDACDSFLYEQNNFHFYCLLKRVVERFEENNPRYSENYKIFMEE